ncbi:3-beta hydroxysteroid dehydrogenase [Geodermatophilus sp. YIM 151500]|uniref:SDR family oxidoreductase n=1 Tax=Geodermatophilus sp. YIM 151500 TaxID=2984531 RepID=UPI0021E46EF0|nr:NAD(P)H-binding protein [Geodermatophilus sp. YIM 151500]MCV2489168.1 3-beta hydroxysteroid dehydrogenase [Geodermatophilus sp. YIM 151500]
MSAMRIAVVGATGLVGEPTVGALEHRGHAVVPVSRSTGVDLLTGAGLENALDGVDAVVDVTNTVAVHPAEAERFFESATCNLLAAEERAGVGHHVVLSIVGLDRIRGNGHYHGKRRQETLVQGGPVPWTIQRTTQFFELPAMVVSWTRSHGAATIPPLLIQPVAVQDVAAVLAELVTGPPRGWAPDLAGPELQDFVDMARRILATGQDHTRLVPSWRDGPFGVEAAGEVLLPGPCARLGTTTFDSWLARSPGTVDVDDLLDPRRSDALHPHAH